ncbi:hypothetical protein [Halorussus caseinilyticus]|uniref:Uncharacterized protein n=1 Tax=Halorussus caseinilyticus TaxID=3034025 RepID=A0ABD5WNY7_9EURY
MSRDSTPVCLLLGFDYLEEWFVDALSEMVDSTAATLELVVLVDVPHKISPEELNGATPESPSESAGSSRSESSVTSNAGVPSTS